MNCGHMEYQTNRRKKKKRNSLSKYVKEDKNQLTWMPWGDLRKKIKNSIQKETKKTWIL